ncbi:MAG: DegV family protein [Lachnospiraceae bacterium]|nr:DegV family protein [Lachnospiraceae bacterium]
MNSYLIYTDSAADIPHHYYKDYDIRIVPMDYLVDGVSSTFHTEAPDHDALCEKICEDLRRGADVHTSQVTPFRFVEYWTPMLEEGHDILYVAFSSGLSSTYNNACSAAMQLKESFPDRTIRVVDSLGATSSHGLAAATAALNRESGMDINANADWLENHIKNLSLFFSVGDLDYLHRGGRVSGAVALIGGKLNLKPVFMIDDEGKLKMTGTARGTNSAFKNLIKSTVNGQGVEDVPKLIFLAHAAQYDKAERLAELLREALPGTVVETVCESPIIAVHTGPEFFAVGCWVQSRSAK